MNPHFLRLLSFSQTPPFLFFPLAGEDAKLELMLIKKMVLPLGSRFTLRNQGVTVGTGVVTEILSDATEDMLKSRWRKLKL